MLAHPDKYLLEEARRAVQIEVAPLPAIFTIEDSLSKRVIISGEDNVFKSYLVDKGNVDAVWASADVIVEGEYRTGAQEQLYIENQGMIAIANPVDGVMVCGSLQCPYYVQKALMLVFDLPADKIRVVQAETGGGFGGKEEYPSMIAAHAALLAWKSGKRVKIIYDRAEDMVATTKRHPSRTRHRTGVTRDSKLWPWTLIWSLTAARTRRFHPSSSREQRSTRRGPTHAPTCASVRRPSRPTRRLTGRFADSAHRKAFLRLSATWTRLRAP